MAVDKYANILTAELTMSAANVLSFTEISTGLGIEADRKSARAMIIDEIEYFPSVVDGLAHMTANTDQMMMGLTLSNAVTDIEDMSDRRILHMASLARHDAGTAATANYINLPWVYQFFPPLITAERKLYLAMDSVGSSAAMQGKARIYYRSVEITQADFIELAEVFRLVG